MLEPYIDGFYACIFKTRCIISVKISKLLNGIQRTLWKFYTFQYLNSESLSSCVCPIRCFLASGEMLRRPVSHHLLFNSLTTGLHNPALLLFFSCSHGACTLGCQWIRSNRASSHPDPSMGLVVRVHQGKTGKMNLSLCRTQKGWNSNLLCTSSSRHMF